MSETSTVSHQAKILRLLSLKPNESMKAGDLKKKLGLVSKDETPQAVEVDREFANLIEQALISVSGGTKETQHPRRNGSYRLTDEGKLHIHPPKPDLSEEVLQSQAAFILMQFYRAKEQRMTRSELNKKLSTKSANGQLEFDVDQAPLTIDYHLMSLVGKKCLEDTSNIRSSSYKFLTGQGEKVLVSLDQYPSEELRFQLNSIQINELLKAARAAAPVATEAGNDVVTAPPVTLQQSPVQPILDESDVVSVIEELHSDKFAGKGLIPIHEVRRLVAQRHGSHAAGHPTFDPVLMRMRSEGRLELIAISDNRNASQEELDASIPGMNSTIFYIVVE
jgi:hypothetical protein